MSTVYRLINDGLVLAITVSVTIATDSSVYCDQQFRLWLKSIEFIGLAMFAVQYARAPLWSMCERWQHRRWHVLVELLHPLSVVDAVSIGFLIVSLAITNGHDPSTSQLHDQRYMHGAAQQVGCACFCVFVASH